MSSETAYSAVRAYLTMNFAAAPLIFENEIYDRPTDATGAPTPFILVEMTSIKYAQASIGAGLTGNLWREAGTIWGHVFVPSGSGSLAARTAAHAFADAFRELTLNGGSIKFGDASIGHGAPGDDDGLYWRLSVTVSYTADF